MTRARWELLNVMTGQGAMSIREAARRLGRDLIKRAGRPPCLGSMWAFWTVRMMVELSSPLTPYTWISCWQRQP